jgi:hypothetical protein
MPVSRCGFATVMMLAFRPLIRWLIGWYVADDQPERRGAFLSFSLAALLLAAVFTELIGAACDLRSVRLRPGLPHLTWRRCAGFVSISARGWRAGLGDGRCRKFPSCPAGRSCAAASVGVYRIGVHTALGEPGVALDHARRVDQHLLPTPERHARFCIDTARAWEQHGRRDRAYETLRAAERHAPEEIRRPSVRTLIAGMLYTPGPPPTGLRSLAARAGAIT